jgi:hypothetical protein
MAGFFNYKDLIARDKASLDIFWLREIAADFGKDAFSVSQAN